jgi:hypothetical protein
MRRARPNAGSARDTHRAPGDDQRPSSRPMERRLSTERRLVIRPMASSPRWLTLRACTRPTSSRLIGAAQLGSSAEAVSTRSSCTEITTIGGVSIPIAAAAGSRFVRHRPTRRGSIPPSASAPDKPGGCRSGSSAHRGSHNPPAHPSRAADQRRRRSAADRRDRRNDPGGGRVYGPAGRGHTVGQPLLRPSRPASSAIGRRSSECHRLRPSFWLRLARTSCCGSRSARNPAGIEATASSPEGTAMNQGVF